MALCDAGVGSACRTLALQHPAWCSHCNTNTCLEVWANPLCEAVGGFPWNRKMTASSQHCGGTQNGSSCTMRLLCRWWCVLVFAPAWPCVCAAGLGAAERAARLCGLLCRQNSCPIKHKCTDLCIHKVLLKRFPCICKSEILSIRYFCSALSYGAEWKHLKDVHPNNSYVHLWNNFFPSPFTFLLLPKSVALSCWAYVCLLEGDGCVQPPCGCRPMQESFTGGWGLCPIPCWPQSFSVLCFVSLYRGWKLSSVGKMGANSMFRLKFRYLKGKQQCTCHLV